MYFFLLLSMCLSKEVLVFNEELLIVFSFSVFIFLLYSLTSNQISLTLDLRANSIKQEFDFYIKIHKDVLNYLVVYYSKQKTLPLDINNFFFIFKKDTLLVVQGYSNLVLKLLFCGIDDKLKKIISLEVKYSYFIQSKIILYLYEHLLLSFSNKKLFFCSVFMKKAIFSLSKLNYF